MRSLDLDKSIFEASASAANDWGAISGGGCLNFQGNIEARRGIDIDLGLMAIANLDSSFSQYITGELSGQAVAQASIRGQIQLPLNLFDEIGIAVRLQAVAELAAGIRIGLGLSVEEFLELVDQDPHLRGLPTRLLVIFLEEVELKAAFFAKAALTAQAYANFVITGSAIGKPQEGIGPGFTITAGAGAGLEAGAGFQVIANVGISNFSKLVGRSVDILVDETLRTIIGASHVSIPMPKETIWAARTPLKLALRMAYEFGEQLGQRNAAHTSNGQDEISLRTLQVLMEELQRACLEGFVQAAIDEFTNLITGLQQQALNEWIACRPQRHALADKLRNVPDELFSPDTIPFWSEITRLAVEVANRFTTGQPELLRMCAVLWSALELAGPLASRVARIQGSISLIGTQPRQVAPAFSGSLPNQPPPAIAKLIRASLPQRPGTLGYKHLVIYLVDQTAVDLLRQNNPALVIFLSDLLGPHAADLPALVRLTLENGAAFSLSGNKTPDPSAALQALATGIEKFVNTKLDDTLRKGIAPILDEQPDLKIVLDEVLLPSVHFVIDIIFKEALGWSKSRTSATALTEAASTILLRVLGRSLVAVGDILLTHAQEHVSELLITASREAGRPDGLVEHLLRAPQVKLAADEVQELVSDALEIAAEVLGPMPEEKRKRVRNLLYTSIDPLGGASSANIVKALNDPGLPNVEVMLTLAQELGMYASERFVLFVQKLYARIIERETNAWRNALEGAVQKVVEWMDTFDQGLRAIQERLMELDRALAEAVAEAQRQLMAMIKLWDQLLDSFSDSSARGQFAEQVSRVLASNALGILEDNWVYILVVPRHLRANIRAQVRSIIRRAVDNQVMDRTLAVIGEISDEIDELIDDARTLDRRRPLGPQLRELVLERIIGTLDGRFRDLRIPINFKVYWSAFGLQYEDEIDLGEIRVPAGIASGAIRPMLDELEGFDDAIQALASSLSAFFDSEDTVDELETEQQALNKEQEHLSGRAGEMRFGARQISIERPLAMQSTSGDVPVLIRFSGLTPAILDHDEETPQRVFIVLNGVPLDLTAFRVDQGQINGRSVGARGVLPHSLGNLSAIPGGSVHHKLSSSPPMGITHMNLSKGVRASYGQQLQALHSLKEDEFLLVGTLPNNLLRKGVNTLLVEAITARDQRLHASVGFASFPAVVTGNHITPTRGNSHISKGKLPKPTVASLKSIGYMTAKHRTVTVEKLKRATTATRVKPLTSVVKVSPSVAKNLGFHPLKKPQRQPILRILYKKEGDNHG